MFDRHTLAETAMTINRLGRFGPVSRLTLGGGGIGQVWGPTSMAASTSSTPRPATISARP
jgi:hypothetical protein